MKNKKLLLIVLEGMDGIGKTTILKELKQKLEEKKIKTLITKEPTNSLGNFKIRDILLNSKYNLTPMMELFLFLLDRNIHIEKKLKKLKKLKQEKLQNEVILCDRSFFSTFVYQGKIGKIPFDNIFELHKLSNSFIWPDLTFFIDVSDEKDFEIINKRNVSKKDRFEIRIQDKHKKISNYYNEVKNYFKIKKPSLQIKTIKWLSSTNEMVSIILKEIINKLNEN